MISLKISAELISRLVLGLVIFTASGCALGPKVAYQSFTFDTLDRKPFVEVADYEYGTVSTKRRALPPPHRNEAITGNMAVGDFLYVRWRRIDNQALYSRRVDLKPLLPASMEDKGLVLVFEDSELLVFLQDMSQYRKPNAPIVGPFIAQIYVTKQIYPPTIK
jgi:hypothetical protein